MYSDFYGFAAAPFQLTPDAAFYFESQTHRKALSYLGYGLAQGEGFVVITGEVGAGKSTLAAHLLATIDPARLTAVQVACGKLDGDEIIHVVAHAFGLAVDSRSAKGEVLGLIERFLHEEARAGRRCLLVVDEVQNLTIAALEELRVLSNFQLGAHPLLQTLLLGQPEFRSALQSHPSLEQLRQRVIASHHLEAMEASEVERYIAHRLGCVGWAGKPSFANRVFADLYTASGGVPRRINQIVNRLLLLGAIEQKSHIDSVMLAQVLTELAGDGGLQLEHVEADQVSPSEVLPRVAAQPAASAAPTVAAPAWQPSFEEALASRDVQIAELQQAVLELADSSEGHGHPVHSRIDITALQERLASLESRVIEQERTLRHTLTMLIEWIERDETHRAAA
jgi:general secretion pathway protein A